MFMATRCGRHFQVAENVLLWAQDANSEDRTQQIVIVESGEQ